MTQEFVTVTAWNVVLLLTATHIRSSGFKRQKFN
jgi:hypothetical protein